MIAGEQLHAYFANAAPEFAAATPLTHQAGAAAADFELNLADYFGDPVVAVSLVAAPESDAPATGTGGEMLEVKQIAGALGAEIQGVDLSGPLPDAILAEIRRALLDHLVIFFRDQALSPAQFLAFARSMGRGSTTWIIFKDLE